MSSNSGLAPGAAVHPAIWHIPRFAAASTEALNAWQQFMLQGAAGPAFYAHPSLLLANEIEPEPPLIVADPTLTRIAALAHKTIKRRVLPGVPITFRQRGYRLVGNRVLGDIGGEAARETVEQLVSVLTSGKASFILCEDLGEKDPLRLEIERVGNEGKLATLLYPAPLQPHWWIDFPDKPEDYYSHHSTRTWKTLKRKQARLEHSMQVVRTVDDIDLFLARAHEISLQSWQSKRLGLRVKNDDRERAFCKALAKLGVFRSYLLEHLGRPIAFAFGIQSGGVFVWEEVGHVASFSDRSPGTVLFLRMLEDFMAHETPKLFDFGYGDGEHKRLFGTRQTMSGPVLLVAKSAAAQVAFSIDSMQKRLGHQARAVFKRLGIGSMVRKLYRRS